MHIKVSSNCTAANPLLAPLPLDGFVPCSPALQSLACPSPGRGQAMGAPRALEPRGKGPTDRAETQEMPQPCVMPLEPCQLLGKHVPGSPRHCPSRGT